jgi:hypothetical protein
LTFLEGLETVHFDCGKMCEQISATLIGHYETNTHVVVEPFNSTDCHLASPYPKTPEMLPQTLLYSSGLAIPTTPNLLHTASGTSGVHHRSSNINNGIF